MQNKHFKIHLFILITVSLQACDYITDLKRTGDTISIEIPWEGADEIEVQASCRIVLVNSDEPKIRISGMDFIAEDYNLSMSDQKLTIRHSNQNRLQKDKVADIYLYSPTFRRLTINAPCHISNADTLRFSSLTLVVNGKGIYTTSDLLLSGNILNLFVYGGINKSRHLLNGIVNNAIYHIEGGTDIDALALNSSSTSITHRSYGHCHVHASDELKVTIFSTGNVYYSGTPVLDVTHQKNSLMKASGQVYRQ